VTKLARNSKPVAKNSLFIDRAAIFGFSVYLSVCLFCLFFFFYLVAVSRDFFEAAPFILIGFLKEIKSPSVNLYMRIPYPIDYFKYLNFKLGIQPKVQGILALCEFHHCDFLAILGPKIAVIK
jgi:hypothetical protein